MNSPFLSVPEAVTSKVLLASVSKTYCNVCQWEAACGCSKLSIEVRLKKHKGRLKVGGK